MAKAAVSVAAKALKSLRKRAGLTVRAVAEAIDRPASSYSTYEDDYKKPFLPVDLVRELQPVFESRGIGRAELWKLAGIDTDIQAPDSTDGGTRRRGAPPMLPRPEPFTVAGEEFAPIPVYDIQASAGFGSNNEEGAPIYYNMFRTQWLRRFSRDGYSRLAVISVRGDSMWETLHDGDHVLIDRGVTSVGQDGIYVLRQGDELAVKRISSHPATKMLTIKSDNPIYPVYSDIDPGSLDIVGRVVWLGRNLG